MTAPAFRVGQWLRIAGPDLEPDVGRACQVRGVYTASIRVRFTDGLAEDYTLSTVDTEFENYSPRPGERCTVTSDCDWKGRPLLCRTVEPSDYSGLRMRFDFLDEPGRMFVTDGPSCEFEPVFEEPEPADTEDGSIDSELTGAKLDATGEAFYGISREDGETDDDYRARLHARWFEMGTFSNAEPQEPITLDAIRKARDELLVGPVNERTEHVRSPRSERQRLRLDSAKEQLSGEWAGRKDRE